MSTPAGDRASEITETDHPGARPFHVAVVGGGITGLSAAYTLTKQADAHGLDLRVTLLDAADRWGGKVRTDRVDGPGDAPFIVEGGPDSFITQKPWALELARELGIEDRLLDTNDDRRQTYVLRRGRPVPLPDGVMMIIPTRVMPFALSPLISIPGKIRMAFDAIIPPKLDGEDETLAEFVTRRLGAEALDRLAEPLMSGIYNAEADRQSLLATFPRFRAIEEKYGSLIRGMLAARRASRQRAREDGGGKKHAFFISLKRGTQELTDALVSALSGDPRVDMRLNAPAARIDALDDGMAGLVLADGERLDVDAIVLSAPAYVAARLVESIAPDAAEKLSAIRYVSTGTVSLGYREDEFEHPLNGFGIVIPRSEGRRINAITWTSTKFDYRAPEGYVLIRVFFGGSRTPEMMEKGNDELVRIVREELADIMGVHAEPVMRKIVRWVDSNAQYDVGHLDRVAAIEAALPPEIVVAGSPYRGVGLPDCVHQGQMAAEQIVERLAAEG